MIGEGCQQTLEALAMRVPRVRLRLWLFMIAVAVSAGLMAETRRRQERFFRLGLAHHQRADDCFDRCGRICKSGETPQSSQAYYRGLGPTAMADYKSGLYYRDLADKYQRASYRPWLPVLPDPPPPNGFRDVPNLAWWALETIVTAAPWMVAFVLALTFRASIKKPNPFVHKRWLMSDSLHYLIDVPDGRDLLLGSRYPRGPYCGVDRT
jgi:hypothetical protein